MRFKQWFNEAAIEMNPWEAMKIMELQGLQGKLIDAKDLRKKFFELSKKYHPDLNIGNQNALEMMIKLNNANAILSKFVEQGKPLPLEEEEKTSSRYSKEPSGYYGGFKKGRPKDSKTVTEEDVMDWCKETLQKKRMVLFTHYPYTGFDRGVKIGFGPYGIKKSQFALPEDITPEKLFDIIKKNIPNFPNSLIDIGHSKYFESYVTFLNQHNNYRSISLEFERSPIKKSPIKKETGTGMLREEILKYFQRKGLTVLRQTKQADFFGFNKQPIQESTFIRVKKRKADVVSVQTVDYGYKKINNDVMVTKEFYFNTITENTLDDLILVLNRRLKKEE
jgi:curved DNA-binding protein CbpA